MAIKSHKTQEVNFTKIQLTIFPQLVFFIFLVFCVSKIIVHRFLFKLTNNKDNFEEAGQFANTTQHA